ncbi:MAG: CDP-alcohol phosphatidyltransferase family protein [Anaerolineales bacterium]|nr:CDP-alcohol phosphatidyltransferase family protein [Anaerolineales bacterium]
MLAQFRSTYQKIFRPLGELSVRLGLGPDFWTFSSVVMSIIAAYFLANQRWGWALIIAIMVNIADGLDGATARARGTSSTFGMVLDHNVDRYVEFILLGGILLSGHVANWLVYSASFGMVMASYVRAKAESTGGLASCTVGFAGRAEKLILLFVGLGLEGWFHVPGSISWAIALIALISHFTFLQRLVYTRQQLLANNQPNMTVEGSS